MVLQIGASVKKFTTQPAVTDVVCSVIETEVAQVILNSIAAPFAIS